MDKMKTLILLLALLKSLAYEPDQVDYDLLINATDYIIEYDLGVVLDDDGNGKVINTSETYYNYISYRFLPVEEGEIIETYLIYNPGFEDDIILRIDVLEDGNIYFN